MTPKEVALLTVLGAIWGLSYVFIRVASPVIGPAVLMALRFSISGAALLAYAASRGQARTVLRNLGEHRWELAVIGLFLAALPTTLIGFAELELTASLATVLNATVPFFAAIGSAVWLAEPLPRRRIAGLVVGFLGVTLAVGTEALLPGQAELLYVAASITAAASYGFVSVFVRRRALPITGLSSSIGSQLIAAAMLVPVVTVTYRPTTWTLPILGSVLGLALLSSALAYVIYFYLLDRAGPTQSATVTFLSPPFGILGGVLLLHEGIGPGLLAGLGLIVVGILLSTDVWMKPRLPRSRGETSG